MTAPALAEVPAEDSARPTTQSAASPSSGPAVKGSQAQVLPWDATPAEKRKHPKVKGVKAVTNVADDGTWRVDFSPVDASGAPVGGVATAAFTASACAGSFFDPNKVAGKLEWGGQQTCSGTFAPQYLRMRLQSTCTSWYCAVFVDETEYLRTPYSEDYTRVSRIFRAYSCDTSTFRKYRIDLFAYVRGVRFGPFISNERVQACDISA